MIKFTLLCLLIGLSLAHRKPNVNETITVPTELGEIQGSIAYSRNGKSIYQFRGIRYAKAPINELRFQPPVPVEKWEGVYDATEDGALCPQPQGALELPISEDCLVLNIYSTELPKGNENPKRPVMFFIHQGGYYSLTGASALMSPKYLLDQEIVLVTINYRLGSLGFLSTGEKEAPGNNGFKDQVAALKFVKNNIAAFGGDPDAVTIAGYSAGGSSVTLHLVSPMSQGLFHKAIIMSGSAFGNWPVPENQLSLAKKQARLVNCPDDNSTDIFKCLKKKTAKELGDSLSGFDEFGGDPIILWSAVIEPDYGQPRFLTEHPIELINKGNFAKVPVLLGVTADEFAGVAFDVVGDSTLKEEINNNFEKVAPIAFIYERDTENSKIISKSLRNFYFSDKVIDNSTVIDLAELYADGVIGFGVNRAAKLLAEYSDKSVFYYRFSFKGRYSHFYLPGTNDTVPYGVVHHDDLLYLFRVPFFPEFNETDREMRTVEKMTTMWANFIKTGKPIPVTNDKLDNAKWETFTLKEQKYLDIGDKLILQEKLYDERYKEWEKLFPLSIYTNPDQSGSM